MGSLIPRALEALRQLRRRPSARWLLPGLVFVVMASVIGASAGRRGASAPAPARGLAPGERPAPVASVDGFDESPGPIQRTSVDASTPLLALPDALPEDAQPGRDRDARARPDKFDCMIQPSEIIDIGSAVTGVIERIAVDRSDSVEAGQTVVELEAGVEKAFVETARARAAMEENIRWREAKLAYEEHQSERTKRMFENHVVSADQAEQQATETRLGRVKLDQARKEHELASLELQQALAVLKRRSIQTPISGVVMERLMSPGEVVDKQAVLRIAQIDPLRVEVNLPASMFGSIKPGMRAAVEPESQGEQIRVASVRLVDRVIDGQSGTFGVRLELPNADQATPGGLHCQLRFLTE
jgi:RND family efflux transporter MFP subunit